MSKQPVRLYKVQDDNYSFSFFSEIMARIEAWVLSHAVLCLFIAMAFLIALFTLLMFALVGVSATESGVQYNHFGDMI